jgi:hypothetical protein
LTEAGLLDLFDHGLDCGYQFRVTFPNDGSKTLCIVSIGSRTDKQPVCIACVSSLAGWLIPPIYRLSTPHFMAL